MVGGKQGYAPSKVLLLQQSLFVSVEFHCYEVEVNLANLSFVDITGFNAVLSVGLKQVSFDLFISSLCQGYQLYVCLLFCFGQMFMVSCMCDHICLP